MYLNGDYREGQIFSQKKMLKLPGYPPTTPLEPVDSLKTQLQQVSIQTPKKPFSLPLTPSRKFYLGSFTMMQFFSCQFFFIGHFYINFF